MKNPSRRAGTTCLRWLALTSCLIGLAGGGAVPAPGKAERPSSSENTKLEALRRGEAPVVIEGNKDATAQNQQILDKFALYFTLRINDPQNQREGLAALHQEAARRLQLPAPSYAKLTNEQRQYVD